MNISLSWSLVVFITIIVLFMVIVTLTPVINHTLYFKKFDKTREVFQKIENIISEIENNSTRIIIFQLPYALEIYGNGDFMYLETDVNLQTKNENNIFYVSGNNVRCYETNDKIVMENELLRIEFRKQINIINTSNLLSLIKDKRTNMEIKFDTSKITIDGIENTSFGSGYYELSKGEALPLCVFKVHIEGQISYDIYYKLFSGMDFLDIEVVTRD